jgi:SAM-dependent methyltransferase
MHMGIPKQPSCSDIGERALGRYEQQFISTRSALEYDEGYRMPGYYTILGRIEREQLRSTIADYFPTGRVRAWLDYATGTGRVIEYARDLADNITGMDVSKAMLEIAEARQPDDKIVWRQGDLLTEPDCLRPRSYDLVTAFRLFLNVDPEARTPLLLALRDAIAPGGLLIINSHGNPFGLKGLARPLRLGAVRRDRRRGISRGNYLTASKLASIAFQAGLRLVETKGCGVLTASSCRVLDPKHVMLIERALCRSRLWSRFGVNQLLVLSRDEGSSAISRRSLENANALECQE